MDKEKIVMIAIGLLVFALMLLYARYISGLDAQREAWSILYEQCVAEEYNTDPSEYYNRMGEYPECDVRKYENIASR